VRRSLSRVVLLVVLSVVAASACGVDRTPLFAGAAGDASGSGGIGSTGGAGGSGGFSATGGVGGVGGSGGFSATGGIGGMGGIGGVSDAAIDAGPIGYEPGKVGAPCTADMECMANGASRTCLSEYVLQPALILPGGYCTTLCDVGLMCEAGSACITIPLGFSVVFACMRECRSNSDCRQAEGYTCNQPFTSNTSVCSLAN
jgi:hypothetical protein